MLNNKVDNVNALIYIIAYTGHCAVFNYLIQWTPPPKHQIEHVLGTAGRPNGLINVFYGTRLLVVDVFRIEGFTVTTECRRNGRRHEA